MTNAFTHDDTTMKTCTHTTTWWWWLNTFMPNNKRMHTQQHTDDDKTHSHATSSHWQFVDWSVDWKTREKRFGGQGIQLLTFFHSTMTQEKDKKCSGHCTMTREKDQKGLGSEVGQQWVDPPLSPLTLFWCKQTQEFGEESEFGKEFWWCEPLCGRSHI